MLPTPDHGRLQYAIVDEIKAMGLQPVPWFIEKIIQVKFMPFYCLRSAGNIELGFYSDSFKSFFSS